MATVAIQGQRDAIVARSTTDRVLLRAFLERDRLFAAYAICDLDDREFARTRWGGAFDGDELVAVALEYAGLSPQPLFVMGADDGIATILRDVIRPRAAYVAALSGDAAGRQRLVPLDPGPQMVRMWVDRTTFRPFPSEVRRLLPVEIGRPQPALPARLRLVAAVVGDRRRRLLRHARRRPARRRGGHPRDQPRCPPRRRRQRPDPRRLPRSRLRQRPRPARSPPSCCGPATRWCSTSAPTTRRRSQAYRRLGYQEHVRFEERLVHRLGAPWPGLHRARSAASSRPARRPLTPMTATDRRDLPPHDVTDLGLAAEGVRRIEWAEREMPVLRLIRERFERERPLDGLRDRRVPARHDRDREPDAHAQGRRRRGRRCAPRTRCRRRTTSRRRSSRPTASPCYARRGEDRDTYYAPPQRGRRHATRS